MSEAVAISPRNGLVRVISPSQISSIEQAEEERKDAQKAQQVEPILNLSQHIETAWQAAYNAKNSGSITKRLLSSLRQRNGE